MYGRPGGNFSILHLFIRASSGLKRANLYGYLQYHNPETIYAIWVMMTCFRLSSYHRHGVGEAIGTFSRLVRSPVTKRLFPERKS
jgi:hypothetical protein